jgi:molecular chaperone GrpE
MRKEDNEELTNMAEEEEEDDFPENPEIDEETSRIEVEGGETEESPESSAETKVAADKEQDEIKEKSIEEIIAEYEDKMKEQEDRFLRLAAEFDNYKKRTARQHEMMAIASKERVIMPFLEIIDNFRRALEAADKSSDFESLMEGTRMVYQHIQDILRKEGVEEIDAVGEKFDPNLHDAVMQGESDEYSEGTVMQELSKGYRLDGKVIRHSRVVVSKGKDSG